MDFWDRKENARTRSRAFYIAFAGAVALAVVIFYFVITVCLMIAFTNWLGLPGAPQTGSFLGDCVQRLPGTIYGSPPQVLSWRPFIIICALVSAFILLMSWRKTRQIRAGGGAYIAGAIGGLLIEEPREAREKLLLNIVEEMSVASGLPRPRVYLLPHEKSINAVTAGLDYDDAIIAVTDGALHFLDRQELQGVVAHEFAHILNGDFSLNLTMAGWLYGLLFLSVQGRDMMTVAGDLFDRDDDPANGPGFLSFISIPMMAIGLVLRVGGALGKFMAELVQAAFSRQREYLADAFAVQFTRYPQGLAGALKKIAGLPRHGSLAAGQAMMMHSFFMVSPATVEGLLRSHPPLEDRIWALEPQWDGQVPDLDRSYFLPEAPPEEKLRRRAASGPLPRPKGQSQLINVAGRLGETWTGALVLGLLASGKPPPRDRAPADPALDGNLHWRGLEVAGRLYNSIPETLREALGDPGRAGALTAAVFIESQGETRDRQLNFVERLLGLPAARQAADFQPLIPENLRLPLLGLLSPALKRLGEDERRKLGRTVRALVAADGKVDLFEVAACQILKKTLSLSLSPPAPEPEPPHRYLDNLREDVVTLLSILAYVGHAGDGEARSAFEAGYVHFTPWWPPCDIAPRTVTTSRELVLALDRLSRTAPERMKSVLVLAALSAALHDQKVGPKEYELLRALAAALDIPLPLADPG
ncbi:MAG: M48 family metalloprotease [Candidatus Adiutrix sp.]|jgi:Zn-dependent protease with chaperone function|nr:M48 family metalloprotease [Candidatus Adiutrix sp.]